MSHAEPDEARGALLGVDKEPVPPQWKKKVHLGQGRFRPKITRWGLCVASGIAILALLGASYFIYLRWDSLLPQRSKPPPNHPALPTSYLSDGSVIEVTNPDRGGLEVLLDPKAHRKREAGVRKYRWVVDQIIVAPDGVEKKVFSINGKFPGPTIEARSGDTLEIDVVNQSDEEISLHWHGLHMRGANHMDGPIGISQCAIPPNGQYTYTVPIGRQSGTFWYHAHAHTQRGDGLFGGLIVHNPMRNEGDIFSYDKELLLMIGDWYHKPSQKALDFFMSASSTGNEPAPDSLLINGQGYFECSMAVPASPVKCAPVPAPWLSLDKKLNYRVRVINVGSLAGISFAVPDSTMQAIQVDGGQRVDPNGTTSNSLGILYPGQRVDLVLSWPEAALDRDTRLTVELDKEYFMRPNFALTPNQSFVMAAEMPQRKPAKNDTEITRLDLGGLNGVSLMKPLPKPGQVFSVISAIETKSREGMVPKGFINHTTWVPQSEPLITLDPAVWDQHQFVPWTGPDPVWVELTINNVDGTGHPFHLHGFDFYVIGSHEANGGWDYYNPFDASKPPRGGPFNLDNPISRDTVYVPPYGYVVIRFNANNEGIWLLHCHILWHQGSGMAMAFQVMGDAQKAMLGTPSSDSSRSFCDSRSNAPVL